MPAPMPGSLDHFFAEILNFLKKNAQGDIRCLILTETSTNQFWLNGQVGGTTWSMGMLKRATAVVDTDYAINIMERHEQLQEELKEQMLKTMKPEGKPQ